MTGEEDSVAGSGAAASTVEFENIGRLSEGKNSRVELEPTAQAKSIAKIEKYYDFEGQVFKNQIEVVYEHGSLNMITGETVLKKCKK